MTSQNLIHGRDTLLTDVDQRIWLTGKSIKFSMLLFFFFSLFYLCLFLKPTKQQLYSHQPSITKTIQIRRTRHAGHCWRSRDELISDVFLWTPSLGREKAGRPARTYIQLLCEDTMCSPEDLPEAMNDRERWRERVRDIRAGGTTRWWWFLILF